MAGATATILFHRMDVLGRPDCLHLDGEVEEKLISLLCRPLLFQSLLHSQTAPWLIGHLSLILPV